MCIIIHISYNTKIEKAFESPLGKKIMSKMYNREKFSYTLEFRIYGLFFPKQIFKVT